MTIEKLHKPTIKGGKNLPTSVWVAIAVGIGALLFAVAGLAGMYQYQKTYEGKIFKNVHINGIDLGGLTRKQAYDKLAGIEKDLQENGMVFYYDETEVAVQPISISEDDPDLAKPILQYDWQRTLDVAEGYGRRGLAISNVLAQLRSMLGKVEVAAMYELDEDELAVVLRRTFGELERPPVDAQPRFVGDEVNIASEIKGLVFSYDRAIATLRDQAERLSFSPIELELDVSDPVITREQASGALTQAQEAATIPDLTIAHEWRSWDISQKTLRDWIEFQRNEKGDIQIGFNKETVATFVEEEIAADITVDAVDAKFEITNGRVVEFQGSQDGIEVDIEKTYERLNSILALGEFMDTSEDNKTSDPYTMQLVVKRTPPKVAVGELNDLGIKELLGEGRSDFSGSPANRRHNIATGAGKLHGLLIAPDEEFSQLDALGEIDGENGWLQELVIKGDRTIPEYGGGLCQVCTTTFRTVLNAGLPITQRRNHSFQVRYYAPAGSDATIYDPAPDFKFVNDTGHHILFLTRIEGSELIYQFWGTDDGRKVTLDPWPPRVSNQVSPGEPRYIETDELAPGEKKLVEHAVPGIDAYFKYTVTYPNGDVFEKEFESHYVPWKETWLVGKDPTATSTATTTAEGVNPDEVEFVEQ